MAAITSLRRCIEIKAFAGKHGVLGTGAEVILKATTGAPSTANKVGVFCWNSFDGDAYICTVAAGTWVKINA